MHEGTHIRNQMTDTLGSTKHTPDVLNCIPKCDRILHTNYVHIYVSQEPAYTAGLTTLC